MLQTYVNEFLKNKARNVSDFVKSLFNLSSQVNLFFKTDALRLRRNGA